MLLYGGEMVQWCSSAVVQLFIYDTVHILICIVYSGAVVQLCGGESM